MVAAKFQLDTTPLCQSRVVCEQTNRNTDYNCKASLSGGGTWVNFCWVCAARASQNPHPIIVYSAASYRPHLSHFWTNG